MKSERSEPPLPPAQQAGENLFRARHSADRATEHHTHALRFQRARAGRQPGGGERFPRGDPRQLVRARAAHPAGQRVHVFPDLADGMMGITRRGEKRERPEAGLSGADGFPDPANATTGGADDSRSSYDWDSLEHGLRLAATNSASARTEAKALSATWRS